MKPKNSPSKIPNKIIHGGIAQDSKLPPPSKRAPPMPTVKPSKPNK